MTDDGMRHIRLFQVCNLFLVVAISTQIPRTYVFAFERTFAVLREKFAWSWENVPLFDRVTNPEKGRYPDACFDGFLVRGAGILSCKPISIGGVSDHFPVVLTLAID